MVWLIVGQVQSCLSRDCESGWQLPLGDHAKVDEDHVLNMVIDKWYTAGIGVIPDVSNYAGSISVVRAVPEECSNGFRVLTYLRWFAPEEAVKPRMWWFHLNEKWQIDIVARFRTGSHGLEIVNHGLPRSQRTCKCCDLGAREDELHFLACSAYNEIRMQYRNIFRADQYGQIVDMDSDMKRRMNPLGDGHDVKGLWRQFASFLLKCYSKRDSVVQALWGEG